MKCTSPPLSGLSKLSHKQLLRTQKFLWFSTTHAPPPARGGVHLLSSMRTKAMAMANTTSHLVLGVSSPATTGDLTVLLQTSAAFLFVYWIANFVMPEIIMKDLQSDEERKDQKPDEEAGMQSSKTISSGTKKKGFQGTK